MLACAAVVDVTEAATSAITSWRNTFQRYARPGDAMVETPRSSAPEVTDYAFAANVHIRAAVPIAAVESPSHPVVVERPGSAEATVRLADDEVKASTRDFHLRFSLAGGALRCDKHAANLA